MDLELRSITDDEFPRFALDLLSSFGEDLDEARIEHYRAFSDVDRAFAAFDGGEMVGTAGSFAFDLTLPGGTAVPVAGVTAVSVRPTHRRQGVLTAMMDHQLDDVARRGECLAVLTASESSIYGRFGYGIASFKLSWTLLRQHNSFRHAPQAGGRIRLVTAVDARQTLPGVYALASRGIPGAVSRRDSWWDNWAKDVVEDRGGATARLHAVHETNEGEVDGYALWRRFGESVLVIDEVHALDDEVEAAMFRFLFDIDLVTEVRAWRRPVDDRLPWRLVDPRQLRVQSLSDDLYVRLVDPAAALAARRYGSDDELVLEVTDPFRPANNGRWLVSGEGDKAACAPTSRPPELALSIIELGSLLLGSVKATPLGRAGRIEERTAGALRRADAFFGWGVAPWLTNGF
jgi:predicted acetyltransferase